MPFLKILCAFFGAITFMSVDAQPGNSPREYLDAIKTKWLDIPYATVSKAQKADIYLPGAGTGPFPIIIFIHGGGYSTGDKQAPVAMMFIAESLKKGYAVVSINYRLVGEAIAPQLIQDVKAAIRWTRANQSIYHLKADKIAVWGPSAGGHLASLAGTSGDVKELEDFSLGNEKESSRVQAVVDWYGPTNFLTSDNQFVSLGLNGLKCNNPGSPASKVIGKNITDAPVEVKAFNPETYISKDDPPFFIQHGVKDTIVPYLQSTQFADSLSKVIGKDKVTLELVEDAGHGGTVFFAPGNLQKVFSFLDKYLKK